MINEKENIEEISEATQTAVIQYPQKASELASPPEADITALNSETMAILADIIKETDINKTKDLTYLFNVNQNKKTMVRINKLNELLNVITDQAIDRFSKRPDQISNAELLKGIQVVQEAIERGQKQITGQSDAPLIQINQQNNEVKVDSGTAMPKESRDKIRNAVMGIINSLQLDNQAPTQVESEIVDIEESSDE